LGRAAAALSDAEAVCSQRPRNARAHVLRGRALLALCRYDAAEAAFAAAAALEPDNAAAREGVASVAAARGLGTDERARGNAAFAAQDFGAAVRHYTSALAAAAPAEERAVLLSNRSAAHLGLRDAKVREHNGLLRDIELSR
jgi:tetratricopeptide (TPR) repeat protein